MSSIAHSTPTITTLDSKLDTKQVVANFIVFQIAWLSCVEAAAHDVAWLGLLAAAFSFCIHLYIVPNRRNAITLTLLSLAIGAVVEFAMVAAHATQFEANASIPPLWMIALWGLFSTTLCVSLRWLLNKYVLAIVLGAIMGPLSYLAGAKIGALTLPHDYSLIAIGICWAVAMPVLIFMAKKWDALS